MSSCIGGVLICKYIACRPSCKCSISIILQCGLRMRSFGVCVSKRWMKQCWSPHAPVPRAMEIPCSTLQLRTYSQLNSTLRLIGVVESRRLLAGRIRRIIELPIPKTAKLGMGGLLMVIVAGIVLLPMAGKPSLAAPQSATATSDSADKLPPAEGAQSSQVAIPAETAATEPNLRGQLVDETGAPVTDAEIELTFSRTYRSVKTKSDKEGKYQFVHVNDSGEYQIAINSNALGRDNRSERVTTGGP